MQNFRAKDGHGDAQHAPDLGEEEYLATIAVDPAVAGTVGPRAGPPEPFDPQSIPRLLAAGVDDWGGVSPVTPGPRQPRAPLARGGGPAPVDAPSAACR